MPPRGGMELIMKIIVVGCGKIGTTVIESLLREGHDIVAIDKDATVIRNLTDIYDVIGVCGSCTDYDTLSEAGVESAELFAAITGSDEVNMLSCFIARKMGAAHTTARIRNPEYNDNALSFLRQSLNLSMSVNPDALAAHDLYHILKMPGAVNIETFSRRNFEMIEVVLRDNTPLDGMKLMDMRKKYPYSYLICTVLRGDELYIPDGNFRLRAGDLIGVIATISEAQKLFRDVGLASKQAKSVMIIGGSRTAHYLAKMLIAEGTEVKVIEKDHATAVGFLSRVPKAVVLDGDGTDYELLLEEGIKSMDALVSLTGMDEQNILTSYSAFDAGVPKVITKINRTEYYPMAKKLGLETLISPKKLIADIFVRYARALQNSLGSNVETMYNLLDGRAEALEFKASGEFKYFNIPLKDMRLKPNILIAGLIRGRRAIIPKGEDVIMQDDRVVVITEKQGMNDLSDIIG